MGYIKTALRWGKRNVFITAEKALKTGEGINKDIGRYAVNVIPYVKRLEKLYHAAHVALKKGDFREMERLVKLSQEPLKEINHITKRMNVSARGLVKGTI